jgi:YD repeat-containing protein
MFTCVLLMSISACHSDNGNPRNVLNRYFTAAIKQDFGAQYEYYYDAYKTKVSVDDYIRHRQEAAVITNYSVESLDVSGDKANAIVRLTFAPSEKLKRSQPVDKTVSEDMVRENGEWKIKVW